MIYLVFLFIAVLVYLPIEVYARWESRIDRLRRERIEDRETFNEVVFGDLFRSANADSGE